MKIKKIFVNFNSIVGVQIPRQVALKYAQKHWSTTIPSKKRISLIPCLCCGSYEKQNIQTNFELSQIGFLGPGYSTYFQIMKLIIFMLLNLFLMFQLKLYYIMVKSKNQNTSYYINLNDCIMDYRSQFREYFQHIFCITGLIIFCYFQMRINNLIIISDEKDTGINDYSVKLDNLPTIRQIKKGYKQHLKQSIESMSFTKKVIVEQIFLNYDYILFANLQKKKNKNINQLRQIYKTGKYFNNQKKMQIELLHAMVADYQQLLLKLGKLLYQTQDQQHILLESFYLQQAYVSFKNQEMKSIFLQNSSNIYICGHKINVKQPYYPKDVFWQNLHTQGFQLFLKYMFSIIVWIFILLICFTTSLLGLYIQYKYKNMFVKLMFNLSNALMNFYIHKILIFMSKYQGHKRMTNWLTSYSIKSVSATLINTIIIPLISYFLVYENQNLDQFLHMMTKILFTNNFFPVFTSIIYFSYYYNKFIIFLYINEIQIQYITPVLPTVRDLCSFQMFPIFPIHIYYSEISVRMISICFFAPLLPHVIIFPLISFVLSYWIHKYNFAKRSAVGFHLDQAIAIYSLIMIKISFCIYFGIDVLIPFIFKSEIINYKVINFGLSFVFMILPVNKILKKIFGTRKKNEIGWNYTYSEAKLKYFDTEYQKENPIFKQMFIKGIMQKYYKKLK